MAQITGTNVQAATGQGSSNFFAALKNGINLNGVQGKLFADLLMQAAAATTQQTSHQAPESTNSQPPVNETPASSSTNINQGNSEDRAALRALLQRIREDAQALHQNRQRIRHISSRQDKNEDDGPSATTAPATTAAANTNAAPAKDSTAAATTTAASDPGATTAPDDATPAVAVNDTTPFLAATLPTAAATVNADATTVKTDDGATAAAGVTSATNDKTDAKAILADMLQAEQAALLLLNKMLQDRINAIKASVSGTTTPTDDATTSTEGVSADTGNVAAAVNTATAAPAVSASVKSQQALPPQTLPLPAEAPADPLTATGANGTASDTSLPSPTPDMGKQAQGAEIPVAKGGVDFSFLNLFNANAAPAPVVPVNTTALAAAAKGGVVNGLSAAGEAAAQTTTAGLNATPANPVGAEGAKPLGSYDFASQLSAARATKGGSTGLPSAIEQVALQLHKQVKDGLQEMTLQLRPAELGRIDIKLTFSDDNKVKGTVVADNQATLDLLSKDVGSLQRALQDAGLRADPGSLQFSLRGDGQANPFNAGTNGHGSSGFTAPGNAMTVNEDDSGMASDAGVETYYLAPGRVNLRV